MSNQLLVSFRKAFPQLRFTWHGLKPSDSRKSLRYTSLAVTLARSRQDELTTTLR